MVNALRAFYLKIGRQSLTVCYEKINKMQLLNPFHAIGLSLYPLKTSEKLRFSDVFRRYRERTMA